MRKFHVRIFFDGDRTILDLRRNYPNGIIGSRSEIQLAHEKLDVEASVRIERTPMNLSRPKVTRENDEHLPIEGILDLAHITRDQNERA